MAAVMRFVNRSAFGPAMGQQYVALSLAAKVGATSFLLRLSSSSFRSARGGWTAS